MCCPIPRESESRKSFGERAADGWHLMSLTEQYRNWIVLVKKERSTDTVYFKHKYLTQPTITWKGRIMFVVLGLKKLLKGNIKDKSSEQYEAVKRLEELFQPQNKIPVLLIQEISQLQGCNQRNNQPQGCNLRSSQIQGWN